jgi:hypothetical protein
MAEGAATRTRHGGQGKAGRCRDCQHPRGVRRLNVRTEQPKAGKPRVVLGTVKKAPCSCSCHVPAAKEENSGG